MGANIDFFYDMPLFDFLLFLRDYNEVITEENEEIKKAAKGKGRGRR